MTEEEKGVIEHARINVKNFCEEKMRKDTCIQDCKLCIKQYFEKQIESEDK